ncbi:nuclear transport factor 2 family protein [Novosphingobium sp. 9]|uniref:nuclear transport factor 2 family protein n=1 Tax=Novosphingobium sp. 9 TaxID=2025349 RepID=UPI0021B5C037|nr:nuclear transport factor 2 family protein [Novosphingobium sp. 9]
MTETIDRLERMLAEHAIARRIVAFAAANDGHDAQGVAAMFVLEGRFARPTDPDRPVIGREAILAFFRDRPARVTRHVMTNILVEIDSPDHARAQSVVTLHTGERGETVMVGGFSDELVREANGEWYFLSRCGSLAFV